MKTSTDTHTLTLPWVTEATSMFLYAEEMRAAFTLAVAMGQNVIFSGPGGHGKSEFLMAAIHAIAGLDPYIRSFGSGTSPEDLYGGINLDALNRQGGK
ncbi:MAG TPA: hypothetical protein VFO38_02610, partial [Candidatus Saccharimonadales bacterium]|nr:hypothetical protein [Candidatus Saccharimonadales bacterium]